MNGWREIRRISNFFFIRRYSSTTPPPSSSDPLASLVRVGRRAFYIKTSFFVIGTVILSPIGYSIYLDHKRTRNVDKAFDHGVSAEHDTMEIERKDVVGRLTQCLTPVNEKSFIQSYS